MSPNTTQIVEDVLKLSISISKRVTFASHQNDVPLIRELSITNVGEEKFENLSLRLDVNPDFVASKEWTIDSIEPESTIYIADRDTVLNGSLLMGLNEAIRGTATFSLKVDGENHLDHQEEIELLSRYEWGGLDHMPELLAAYVMPNDPAIDSVLKTASDILRRAGQDSSIDGYISGERRRVWQLSAAIWNALQGLNLSYAVTPSSFEKIGQKVRLPTQILEKRLGNCLDLTLLFAGILEQLGLYPVVVLLRGHSFVGVWLQPDSFSSLLVEDCSTVRKRIDLDELIVFETTAITNTPSISFKNSINKARQQLSEEQEAEFEAAIDIQRARMQNIKPLSVSHEEVAGLGADSPEEVMIHALEQAPNLPTFKLDVDDDEPENQTPQTRLEKWQKKLLDLTLRNKLLNFKGDGSKKTVELYCPDPAALEDKIADGVEIKILPAPKVSDERLGRSEAIHSARHGESLNEEYALNALLKQEVVSLLPKNDLDARLTDLYRTAKNDMEEGGANTLFLVLGLLKWKREKEERTFRSPLIMVPVILKRRSIRSGIRMVMHEDESRFNTTLLEMLRRDFNLNIEGFDDSLPEDESGIDVKRIWGKVRSSVKDIEGFEVTEDVYLSTFSFSKYLMWKDLVDRQDQLRNSSIVRHLLETPKDRYESGISFPEPRSLDRDVIPANLFVPLDYDSSQLRAIAAAERGKDFVLIGPPGTGKSQTIANIICHNLAIGKTVLFVSEKKAALDVVYSRLNKLGLGDFCLQLHSNKAKKREILDQFKRAWESTAAPRDADWSTETRRLTEIRERLNRFVEHAHKEYPNGLTPYKAMGVVIANPHIPSIDLSWSTASYHSAEQLDELRKIVIEVDVHLSGLGVISDHSFAGIENTNWSPSWQSELISNAKSVQHSAADCQEVFSSLTNLLAVQLSERTIPQITIFGELVNALNSVHDQKAEFLFSLNSETIKRSLESGLSLIGEYKSIEDSLSGKYRKYIWRHLDLGDLAERWESAGSMNWVKAKITRRDVRKALGATKVSKEEIDYEGDIGKLRHLEKIGQKIDGMSDLSQASVVWDGFDTNVDVLNGAVQIVTVGNWALSDVSNNVEEREHIRESLDRVVRQGSDWVGKNSKLDGLRASLSTKLDQLNEDRNAFLITSSGHSDETGSDAKDLTSLGSLVDLMKGIHGRQAELNLWCAWRDARATAIQKQLLPLVEAIEDGRVPPGQSTQAFDVAYCRWWINSVVDADVELSGFVSDLHQTRIEQFRETDKTILKLAPLVTRARLASEDSSDHQVERNAQFGILKREIERKRQNKPLRQLVSEIPTALSALTPCVLMSPLSIAQYLPASQQNFDLVIFDEASQITVEDSIGAIARAKSAIIVGDPKQLPPTRFFGRSDDDDDPTTTTEADLESILDECLGGQIPALSLNWHYRSRHESLISFSNSSYYGGGLVTFPSPSTDDQAVRLQHVPGGIFQRGGARTNEVEAKALVRELTNRMLRNVGAKDKLSFGVVTFNSEQRTLINDLLDQERRKNSDLEIYFSDENPEACFSKNIETVQGDERDVIFFSITFGKDPKDRITMNFGPMNSPGGERRLNVAITRARRELIVFSSIKAEQIDLSRTAATGVQDLKRFLDFAERGKIALADAATQPLGDYENIFEEAIGESLQKLGWSVHPQVGVSGYRIDLGIVNPDMPGRYLAGVECDGATYHSSHTARDRDKVREGILRGLKWEILRVWSTDWWINRQGATEKLDNKLKQLLENSREEERERQRQLEAEKTEPEVVEETPQAEDGEDVLPDEETAGASYEEESERIAEPIRRQQSAGVETTDYTRFRGRDQLGPSIAINLEKSYEIIDLPSLVSGIEPDKFYDRGYDSVLKEMGDLVVSFEGPVREEVLATRIARAHGWKRTGKLITERVIKLLRRRYTTTKDPDKDQTKFYWSEDIDPKTWDCFRLPATEDDNRSADDICFVEIGVIARRVLSEGASDPAKSMADLMQIRRLSQSSRTRLNEVFERVRNGDPLFH